MSGRRTKAMRRTICHHTVVERGIRRLLTHRELAQHLGIRQHLVRKWLVGRFMLRTVDVPPKAG